MLCSRLLCACLWLVTGYAHDDDWIDPTDMLNYDAASGTMRKPQPKSRFEDSFGVDPYNVFMVLLCLLCIVLLVAIKLWTYVRHYTKFICSLLALGGTFINLVMDPWKYIGKGTGQFVTALMKEIPVLYQVVLFIIVALGVLGFCYGAGNSLHLLRCSGGPRREPYQGFQPGDQRRQQRNDFRPSGGAGDADSYCGGQIGPSEQGPYDRMSEGKRHVLKERDADLRIHTGHESPEVLPVSDLPETDMRETPQVSDLSDREWREVLPTSDLPDTETRERPEVVSSPRGTGGGPGEHSPSERHWSTAGSRPPLSSPLAGRPQGAWTARQQQGRPSSRLMPKAAPRRAAPPARQARLPEPQEPQEQQVEGTRPVARVSRGTRTRTAAWRRSFCVGIL
ncbi:chloride channel CLIC-like protein 1 [Phyllostomus hastatus]|uniref:chloride channel CLIC-like protein 1 n=1 Tax=Phyllostomus hastatus TaxID=9423 RepID=UPI001E680D20|nr:chloride channel CLIC-like protein 1 [Phyllostomus hastatus]